MFSRSTRATPRGKPPVLSLSDCGWAGGGTAISKLAPNATASILHSGGSVGAAASDGGDALAVALFGVDQWLEEPREIGVDLADLGLGSNTRCEVRDLWTRTRNGSVTRRLSARLYGCVDGMRPLVDGDAPGQCAALLLLSDCRALSAPAKAA